MKHGEFDPPSMVPYKDKSKYGLKAYPLEFYDNVSLGATRDSMTLLKNLPSTDDATSTFLPLSPRQHPTIAVDGIYTSMFAGYDTAAGENKRPNHDDEWFNHTSKVLVTTFLTKLGFNVTVLPGGCKTPESRMLNTRGVSSFND